MEFSKSRIKTDTPFQKVLSYAVVKASDQKLLPRFIWDLGKQHKTQKLFKDYRKDLQSVYSKQLRLPIQYNPQQAKSHRQKFRQKVLKLLNHDLQVDYLAPMKIQSKKMMAYKGHNLEQIQYQTKKQYDIFQNFNQQNFNHGLTDIFQDKLEYSQKGLISYKKKRTVTQILPQKEDRAYFSTAQKTTNVKFKTQETTDSKTRRMNATPSSLPKLSKPDKMMISKRITPIKQFHSPRIHTQRLKLGKIISGPQDQQILKRMQKIGGYGNIKSKQQILLTKQSILKYLKSFYEKPHRIVDFLEISTVQNYQTFNKKISNLKLMPKKHIQFMVFLFYDTNNDGYICQADLYRLQQLTNKNPILLHDLKLIRKYGQRYKLDEAPTYYQLYKRSQITQTVFFNWSKSDPVMNQNVKTDVQLKNYMLNQKKRNVFIDFKGFTTIFKKDKPFFWYDLMYKLSGLDYEGLDYQ